MAGKINNKKEIINELMGVLVDHTDNQFYARFESDCSGVHITVYVERESEEEDVWKKELHDKFQKWRIIKVIVKKGYIDGVLVGKKSDNP